MLLWQRGWTSEQKYSQAGAKELAEQKEVSGAVAKKQRGCENGDMLSRKQRKAGEEKAR